MTDVEKNLDAYFVYLADCLKNRISCELTAISKLEVDMVLSKFFENHSVRYKYLGEAQDDFIFVNLHIHDIRIEELDKIILNIINPSVGSKLNNITELRQYLEKTEKLLVLYFSANLPVEIRRFLYSYFYLLSGRVVYFVYVPNNFDITESVERRVYIQVAQDLLKNYFLNTLAILGLDARLTDQVFEKIMDDYAYFHKLFRSFTEQYLVSIDHHKRVTTHVISEVETLSESLSSNIDSSAKKVEATINSKSDQTHFDGKHLSAFLTRREQELYDVLREKKFISRDELVEIVWGKSMTGNVSNDAIDQFISRLRKKFVKAGFSKDYIYVVKGKGVGLKL
jgi:hypothetical protein